MKELVFDFLGYQHRIVTSDKPYLALIGGTGCGKTWLLPRWLYTKMNETPKQEWIVSAPTIPMLKRNPWKYCLEFFKEYEIPVDVNKTDMIIRVPHLKSTVYFISAENPDRMQGIHARGIIGDEAGMFDRLWWDTAVQRVAYRKGQILLLTTPYAENWLKTEVWDKWMKGDQSFHVENPTSLDNPFYPREEYERARERLPEWKFKMLFEGKFTKPAGLIYPQYQTVERFKIPADWFVFGGVDFGFNNPFAVVWVAENPKTGELFIFDEFKKAGLTVDDMEKVLKGRRCTYYGDPSSKEVLETLRARGIDIRPAKKDVMAGITYLQGLFKSGKLKIFRDLKYFLDEINSYQWEMDRREQLLDKPRKENDHLCVTPETMIITIQGVKPIKDIQLGDYVLSHTGKFRKVIRVYKRFYKGKILELTVSGKEKLNITPEHPVLVGIFERSFKQEGSRKLTGQLRLSGEPRFILAKLLSLPETKTKPRQFLVFPKIDLQEQIVIDMKNLLPSWIEKDGFLFAPLRNGSGINPKSPKVTRFIPINKELAFLIGYYVANGTRGGNVLNKGPRKTVSLCGHISQETILPLLEKALVPFGSPKIHVSKEKNRIILTINSKALFEFFASCLKNPYKRFPDYSFRLGYYETLYMVAGYLMGDGCFSDGTCRANTVSRELAYQLAVLLIKLELKPKLKYVKRAGRWKAINGLTKRDQYAINLSIPDTQKLLGLIQRELLLKKAFEGKKIVYKKSLQSSFQSVWVDSYLFSLFRGKETKNYEGYVYNLEVEEDNSYVANGVVLHNCDATRYAIFTASGDRPGSIWASPLGVTRTTARMFRRW